MSPEGGTYSFVRVPARRDAWGERRDAWGVRRPQLTLSDHLRKKLFRYLHNFFLHIYGVNSLAGIDFQQFLKNKMAATAILFADSEYWRRPPN